MNISLDTPLSIAGGNAHIETFALDSNNDANLYITCSHDGVKENLVEEFSRRYNPSRAFSALEANEALDRALKVDGATVKKCNLTLLLLHHGGALAMQTGEGRLVQLRPGERNAAYDSRDQVLDIYSARAKVMQLTDVKRGDLFLLTTAGRFNVDTIVNALRNTPADDAQAQAKIEKTIQAPTLLLPVASAKGSSSQGLAMDTKWWKRIAALVVVLAALAVLTFFIAPLTLSSGDNEADVTVIDTTVTTQPVQAERPEALPQAEPMPEQTADRPAARERNVEKQHEQADEAEHQSSEQTEAAPATAPDNEPAHEPAPAPAPTPTPAPEPTPAPTE